MRAAGPPEKTRGRNPVRTRREVGARQPADETGGGGRHVRTRQRGEEASAGGRAGYQRRTDHTGRKLSGKAPHRAEGERRSRGARVGSIPIFGVAIFGLDFIAIVSQPFEKGQKDYER